MTKIKNRTDSGESPAEGSSPTCASINTPANGSEAAQGVQLSPQCKSAPTGKGVVQGKMVSGGGWARITTKILLSQIVDGAGTQARTGIDKTLVDEYAEAMQDGAAFPPIVVYSDGEKIYLADGFHRTAAARKCGFVDIDAIVEQGTARDALWYALGANNAHGLRMSRADVRQAIKRALQEFLELSNREIARQIGCGDQLVREVRAELESNCVIHAVEKTVGADGKLRPAKRKAKPASIVGSDATPSETTGACEDIHTSEDVAPRSVEHAANDSVEQPPEEAPKAVGLARAQQALDLLQSIPENDEERPQAIALITAWTREVQSVEGMGPA